MARSDLLLNLVKAGTGGERELFDQTVSAIIAEERSKQHHVLADNLTRAIQPKSPNGSLPGAVHSFREELVYERQPEVGLSDVVLTEDVRHVVDQLLEEQERADVLRSYNLEPRSRVLLTGPPGNGKTSLAEAIACSLSLPMYIVRYDSLITSYLGETAQRLRELFQYVRVRRCVLFFDEFDAVGKERSDIQETGEIKRVLNSLLLEIDKLPSYVVLIAATNHPELLDRAAWRRFQIKALLDIPNAKGIESWLTLLTRRFPHFEVPNPKSYSKRLIGYSFSELEDMAQEVMRRRVLDGTPESSASVPQVMNLWISNLSSRGATNGKPTYPDLSNPRNGSAIKEGRWRTSSQSANGHETKRPSIATNPKTRGGVRLANGAAKVKPRRG